MSKKDPQPNIFAKAMEANAYWIEYCAFCFDHIGKPNAKLCREYALMPRELWAGKKTLGVRREDYCKMFLPFMLVSTTIGLVPPPFALSVADINAGIALSFLACSVRQLTDELSTRPASDNRAVIFTAARDKWMNARQERMHQGQHGMAASPA